MTIQLNIVERKYSLWQENLGPIQLVSKSCFLKKDFLEDTKKIADNWITRNAKKKISMENVKL